VAAVPSRLSPTPLIIIIIIIIIIISAVVPLECRYRLTALQHGFITHKTVTINWSCSL
jgi:hypothetical protein